MTPKKQLLVWQHVTGQIYCQNWCTDVGSVRARNKIQRKKIDEETKTCDKLHVVQDNPHCRGTTGICVCGHTCDIDICCKFC